MNSKTLILTLAASLAWGGFAFAQEGEEKKKRQRPEAEEAGKPAGEKGKGKGPGQQGQGKGQRPGGGIADALKKLDTDGDGNISKEEAGERWDRIARMDKNKDGAIGSDEIPQARPSGGRPSGGGNPEEMAERIFGMADRNGDGKITADEAGERWERLSAADGNEDDGVDKAEFTKMMKERMAGGGKGSPGGGSKGGGQMFERADKNKDGKLTEDEVPAEAWARLKNMDKNGDGAVAKDELPQRPGGGGKGGPGQDGKGKGGPGGGKGGGPTGMFDRFDKDEDGKLSKEEVPEEMWANLSRADDDADGRVSQEELQKVFSQRQGGGKGKADGGPGRPKGN